MMMTHEDVAAIEARLAQDSVLRERLLLEPESVIGELGLSCNEDDAALIRQQSQHALERSVSIDQANAQEKMILLIFKLVS